ncbi:MAG: trigger factor [Oscillospiraceae bacterium]|nr:trigger factor [Oscillospiraceae bacterium]
MNVTAFEKKEKNTAALTVEIEPSVFNAAIDGVYKKMRGQISVPGFRRGKAPRKIIENMYGASVFYSDALDDLLPTACAFGVREKELRAVGYPSIGNVEVKDDKSVDVEFTVELYPEVKIGEYKGLHAVKPSAEVPESAVDARVETMRYNRATVETVTRPAIGGDIVLIDYAGTVDGELFEGGSAEGHELTLGSNSFIPGFENQVQGMVAGEERDIEVTFPEDYHAEHLAGKPAVFKVTVKEVRSKVLPEADDEFAKDISEFDTLAEYRADVRAELEKARALEVESEFENALLEKLAEGVEAEIPEIMFEERVENSLHSLQQQLSQYGMDPAMYFNMMGTSEEAFRENARPQAERQVKVALALEKIAEIEALDATEEEIEGYYAEMAASYGAEIDDVKDSVEKDDVKRELVMRAAARIVRDSGIADEKSETPAVEEKPKKPRKAPAKKKAEPAPEEAVEAAVEEAPAVEAEATAAEEAPKPKRTRAKKPVEEKTEEKTEE